MGPEGPDVLFENHTVKEIQEIEKKLRNDIERKKEELRQMVGERYRDLMEAADTITEMKDIAESVTKCVKSIETRCTKLQNSNLHNSIFPSIHDKVDQKKKSNELLYTIASQLKILIDSPSRIWSYIENKDFVSAVSLYLLARHTHSLLLLSPFYQSQNVVAQLPIIQRQWLTINQFRNALLQNSQMILESLDAEPEDVLGPLCCQCLLTNTSLQQTLIEILNTRKNLLRSIFRPEKYAKTQVLEFSLVVQLTVKIVYMIFYPSNELSAYGSDTNLLYHSLMKLISIKEPGPVSLLDLKSSEVFKFLPAEIIDFRPILNSPPEKCSLEFLQSNCNDWLQNIRIEFQDELRDLLNFVNTIKNLSLIQESLFESLCEINKWNIICDHLLNKTFSIWDFFFNNCFLQRIKDIINDHVKNACQFCQKNIEETLYEIGCEPMSSKLKLEKNINLYIWSESSNDIVDNVAWHPRHHRNYWNSGELSMKSMGFTPKVQSICKDFDKRIQDTLEDISHFSSHQIQTDPFNIEKQHALQIFLAEISKENEVICQYLVQSMQKYFSDLLKFVEATLSYLESEKNSPEKSSRFVFLGHLCNGIANLCPHVNIALSGENPKETIDKLKNLSSRGSFLSSTMKENETWKSMKKQLLDTSAMAFRSWSKDQIKDLISTVESELIAGSAEGLLKILLQWDKIEIQEESEQGNSVSSVLRIPQHISTPVSNALFTFCCKLNSIGGFSLNCEVRSTISKQLLLDLLDVYKQKVSAEMEGGNARLRQVQSLQLLFDVQFLTGLLVHKGNTFEDINNLSQSIINEAISYIDPFDMDVFAVPLQQNVRKALQKSLSLFGLLTSPDQVSYLNSYKSHSVSNQMDYNVMLTSGSGARFPLLPLPSKINTTTSQEQLHLQPKEMEVKSMQHSHSSSPNLNAADTSTNPLKSTASFYEKMTAMSSSWFGN